MRRGAGGVLPRGALVAALLFAGCLAGWQPVRAQPAGQPGWRGLTLAAALDRLNAQGANILYSTDLVRPELTVASEPRAAQLPELLAELLAPHGLQARPGPGGITMIVEGPRRGSIEGLVRRADTRAPLENVRLVIDGGAAETRSDAAGHFVLPDLAAGRHALTAEHPGYGAGGVDRLKVVAESTTHIVLAMGPRRVAVEQVDVRARDGGGETSGAASHTRIEGEAIRRSPEVAPDTLMAVGRLPGVANGEAAGELSVRGGAADETLILLDGLELYDPFHVRESGGLSGIIDPGTIGDISFLGAAFPAEYGGRMSGVLDVQSLTPEDHPAYGVTLRSDGWGLSGSGGFREAGHWLVSARYGNFTQMLEGMGADPTYNPQYYDFFAKVDYRFTPASRLQLNALRAADSVTGEDGDLIKTHAQPGTFRSSRSSDYVWLGLDTTWHAHLVSRTVLSYGLLNSRREGSSPFVRQVDDSRRTRILGLKQDWLLESGRHVVKWGADLRELAAGYSYHSEPVGASPRDIDLDPEGQDIGLYATDTFKAAPGLTLQAGLRWDRQTYAASPESSLSPRLNITWAVRPGSTLRAGWGYCDQPEKIHELQVQDGVAEFAGTQHAQHTLIGFDQSLPAGLVLHVDAYRKRMSDLRPRYENLYDTSGFFPEADFDRVLIDPDRARARGLEIGLERATPGKVSWAAAWTLASVEDQVDGQWVPRSWDQRQALDLSLALRPADGWVVTFAGAYHTGRPITPLSAEPRTLPDGTIELVPVPGARNSERLPDYQRLDMRVSRELALGGTRLVVFAGATNLLGRENVCCVESFSFQAQPGGGVQVDRDDRAGLPRLFTFGATWRF